MAVPARPGLRQHRRTRNEEHISSRRDSRRCECARPSCEAPVPMLADAYRSGDEFIVIPLHVDGDRTVILDDRFAVVRSRAAVGAKARRPRQSVPAE